MGPSTGCVQQSVLSVVGCQKLRAFVIWMGANMFGWFKRKSESQISLDIRTERDVERLIREHGPEKAGLALRKLAYDGNLVCQIALSQLMVASREKYKMEHVRNDCETFTKMAAEQGDAGSQFNLAKLYTSAVDSSADRLDRNDYELIEQAKYWHRKAAAQGFRPAMESIKLLESAFPERWFRGAT